MNENSEFKQTGRFEIYRDKSRSEEEGQFYWRFFSQNSYLARSEQFYTRKNSLENALISFKRQLPGAEVVDHTGTGRQSRLTSKSDSSRLNLLEEKLNKICDALGI